MMSGTEIKPWANCSAPGGAGLGTGASVGFFLGLMKGRRIGSNQLTVIS